MFAEDGDLGHERRDGEGDDDGGTGGGRDGKEGIEGHGVEAHALKAVQHDDMHEIDAEGAS